MWIIWGPATEVKDLGVVAEQCPLCNRTTPCVVRSVCQGLHVFFMKMTAATQETSCRCTVCSGLFPCELWRYPALVPVQEANALSVEALLSRTNPGLIERLQLNEQVAALGGDARFAIAYVQLEGMRPGALRAELLQHLLDWEILEEEHRERLAERIAAWSRAWTFARQVAPEFPGHAGCLLSFLSAAVIWSAFLWLPLVHDWVWGTVTVVAGCAAAALTGHLLLTRRVRRWTREVLVPQAQRTNVSLACFLAVVDDLPGSSMGMLEDLWPVKDQLETIRGVLVADQRL